MGNAARLWIGWRCLVAAGVVMAVGGCAGDGGAGEPEEVAPRPVLVGRVASLPGERDFVLLQSYGAWSVPAGSPVYAVGPGGRTANLLPTGEKMGQFVAADLRGGAVEIGDAVYFRPGGEAPEGGNGVAESGAAGGGEAIEPELPRQETVVSP